MLARMLVFGFALWVGWIVVTHPEVRESWLYTKIGVPLEKKFLISVNSKALEVYLSTSQVPKKDSLEVKCWYLMNALDSQIKDERKIKETLY